MIAVVTGGSRMNYWLGSVSKLDNFGDPIVGEFYDAVTTDGPWAIMTPSSWQRHGVYSSCGVGRGQRYVRQDDGRWLRVE